MVFMQGLQGRFSFLKHAFLVFFAFPSSSSPLLLYPSLVLRNLYSNLPTFNTRTPRCDVLASSFARCALPIVFWRWVIANHLNCMFEESDLVVVDVWCVLFVVVDVTCCFCCE